MSEENPNINQNTPPRGRTWADVFVNGSYIIGAGLFLVAMGAGAYFILGEVPTWFFIALASSVIFIPFLQERAKDGTDLILVTDEPFKLTEYRIGRKVGLEIEGNGVQFSSRSGIYRTVLNGLDVQAKKGWGSNFGGFTQIDQVRDMNTLNEVVRTLENTLKDSRISAQTVGIEVEKQSIKIVDWALKTIYGSIIPTEVSEAFGIDEENIELNVDDGLEEIEEVI
jgi:hypothetical protein